MIDKAYIVANKQQELDVLNKFEEKGLIWLGGEKSTEWLPSESGALVSFPYSLIEEEKIAWLPMTQLSDQVIVYDGRKEEKMYKVTQEFMDSLIKWRDEYTKSVFGVNAVSLTNMPEIVRIWRFEYNSSIETNKRFGAIVNWINGEDVFEIGTPKYIVQRSGFNLLVGNEYLSIDNYKAIHITRNKDKATRFDDFEKASEWANKHFEVVEVDEYGNKVD